MDRDRDATRREKSNKSRSRSRSKDRGDRRKDDMREDRRGGDRRRDDSRDKERRDRGKMSRSRSKDRDDRRRDDRRGGNRRREDSRDRGRRDRDKRSRSRSRDRDDRRTDDRRDDRRRNDSRDSDGRNGKSNSNSSSSSSSSANDRSYDKDYNRSIDIPIPSKIVARAESKEVEPDCSISQNRYSSDVSSNDINLTNLRTKLNTNANFGLSGALAGDILHNSTSYIPPPTASASANATTSASISTSTCSSSVEPQKQKADFGLSGALVGDTQTGNTKNGVTLKYQEPEEASFPSRLWRLYVFKDDSILETLHISRQSCFLIGKDDRVCDIVTPHPSISKQHAVIQFRKRTSNIGSLEIVPYIMDLGSTNKTLLNGQELDDARYYEMREKDCLRFGLSSREYVLLHEESKNAK